MSSTKTAQNKKIIMQSYLKTNQLSVAEKQFAFELRCRNYHVKSNFKTQFEDDMRCRLCMKDDSYEDENHVFFLCDVLLKDQKVDSHIKLGHLYDEPELQVKAIKYFKQIAEKRKLLLDIRNVKF